MPGKLTTRNFGDVLRAKIAADPVLAKEVDVQHRIAEAIQSVWDDLHEPRALNDLETCLAEIAAITEPFPVIQRRVEEVIRQLWPTTPASPSLEACVLEMQVRADEGVTSSVDIVRRHWPTAPAVEPPKCEEHEAKAAQFRAEIRDGDGKPEGTIESLLRCVKMLNTYAADSFPANEHGQVHFVRAIMESAADEIAAFVAAKPAVEPSEATALADDVKTAMTVLETLNMTETGLTLAQLVAENERLKGERAILALERHPSDSEMNALLKRVNKEFSIRAEAAEDALRSLASWLAAGGYNATHVDADVFEQKIRDGVDMLLKSEVARQTERLRARLLTAAGDDLCRLTQEEIKDLSSGKVQIPPKEEFLASCERFHAQIASKDGVMSNCLTLAQLVAENERLRQHADCVRIPEEGVPEAKWLVIGPASVAEMRTTHAEMVRRMGELARRISVNASSATAGDSYLGPRRFIELIVKDAEAIRSIIAESAPQAACDKKASAAP